MDTSLLWTLFVWHSTVHISEVLLYKYWVIQDCCFMGFPVLVNVYTLSIVWLGIVMQNTWPVPFWVHLCKLHGGLLCVTFCMSVAEKLRGQGVDCWGLKPSVGNEQFTQQQPPTSYLTCYFACVSLYSTVFTHLRVGSVYCRQWPVLPKVKPRSKVKP